MAVILQTRCFQMDNCEPDLSFSKYVELDCFCWLYIYGHICDFRSRYAQLKEYILFQSEQSGDWHQMKTTGPREQDWSCDEVIKTPGLKRLDYCELMNTYRMWWRHKTSIFRSFRFNLRGGGGVQTHFSDKYLKYFLWNSYQVNTTTPHWSLVNIGSGSGLVQYVEQQAITWANVDPDLWHHVASLGHNGLT